MDHERFFRELQSLYENWAVPGWRPRSRRFDPVLASLLAMTTTGVVQLLNHAVSCLEANEIYCEVGCFQGATLIGALLDHPAAQAEAVDNFSEFDPRGQNHQTLLANLERFGLRSQVRFHNEDFERFFLERRRQGHPPIGAYLYDGAHDYRSQMMGLLLAVPHLSERALIVVDDANYPPVRQATWDFVAAFPQARLGLEILTPGNGHPDFWNGLHVLTWDRHADNGYAHAVLRARREESLVHAMAMLFRVPLPGDTAGAVSPR